MKRVSFDDYLKRLREINKNVICIGEYKNTSTKILHKCLLDGHEWEIAPKTLLKGHGCPKCKSNKNKLKYEDILKNILEHNCKLITTRDEFNKLAEKESPSRVRLKLECSCGKEFSVIYNSFANGKRTCNHCSKLSSIEIKNKQIREDMAKEVVALFKSLDCVLLDEYIDAKTKMRYIGSCGHEDSVTYDSFKNRDNQNGMCTRCARKVNSGENAYNWKGGYTDTIAPLRKTYKAKEFVKQVMKRDSYKCVICATKNNGIVAHHLNGFNWDKENRYNVDNGVTLCGDCHKEFHGTYGYGDNTKEQFLIFIKTKLTKL